MKTYAQGGGMFGNDWVEVEMLGKKGNWFTGVVYLVKDIETKEIFETMKIYKSELLN